MAKRKSPSYITLTDKKTLNTMIIPANRAARREDKKRNRRMAMLPPVLYPYVKKENQTR